MNDDDIELDPDLHEQIRSHIGGLTAQQCKEYGEYIRQAEETLRRFKTAINKDQPVPSECADILMQFDEDMQRLGLPGFIPLRG